MGEYVTELDILLSTPDVGEVEYEYVMRALRSGWVAPAGPDLTAFEDEVAARVGVNHGVGLSSGTAALHLAMVSWGLGPGDVIPVSTLTFAATVNAIRYVGAVPWFVDCDIESGNMDPSLLEDAVDQIRESGVRAKTILPVDLLGKCVDYTAISEIAASTGARVLCDAAESFGATFDGAAAGSLGDAAVISFNGNKIMTTSGGGMLLTSDARLATHARKLATQARELVTHYEHVEVGFNYRLSNILAALGRAQLVRLDEMIGRRRELRRRYAELLREKPGVRVLGGASDRGDNCWLTALIVDPTRARSSASTLGEKMRSAGIETRPLWKPMHLQPVNAGFPSTLNGASNILFANGITLPSGSALTETEITRIETVLAECL